MNKYFLFVSSSKIDRGYFAKALEASGMDYQIEFESDHKGYFLADGAFYDVLDGVLSTIHDDLGISMTVLVSHARKGLEERALRIAFNHFPNQALFLSDVILKEFSFGDFSSLPLLRSEFKNIDFEVMQTARVYLRCGMNALRASEKLFIHRNTFNYRMNRFIEETGLDIRDYHNALLLELYFQFATR